VFAVVRGHGLLQDRGSRVVVISFPESAYNYPRSVNDCEGGTMSRVTQLSIELNDRWIIALENQPHAVR